MPLIVRYYALASRDDDSGGLESLADLETKITTEQISIAKKKHLTGKMPKRNKWRLTG
jgi:hypothetical protein